MKKRIINFTQKPFVRNVTILASGTAAGQAITMGLSPIITRMYGPEAFGLMGAFMAIVSIVAPIAALTYPIAIVLPKSDQDAKGLIRLSLIVTTIISIISLLILLIFNKSIIEVFNLNKIGIYLYLIPLVIIFSGLMEIGEQWLIRTKQFSINARVTFLHSVIMNGGQVGIGFFMPIASVLIVISSFGNGLKAAMMFVFSKRANYQSTTVQTEQKKSMSELAKEYNDFPLFRAPQVFLNAISQGLPVLLLTMFFGPISAGLYTIGRTVLSAPSQLIGKSVGDVFYPRISQAANNNENLTKVIKKATLALALAGIIPFGLVIVFGPYLFSFVFGSDWYVAGEYARWTALWVYFMFMNQPSVRALPVLAAQKFHLKYTFVTITLRLLALSIGFIVFNDDIVSVALFGITGAILNIILILITLKISKGFKQ